MTKEHAFELHELPGGAVSPGGASNFRFEYEHRGERLLFWGWTGPNDIRVMDENLNTTHVIEMPSEGFDVHGARWSHGGSIIVWGNNGTGPTDSLLFYSAPTLELNISFLPREVIPLVTIDSVSLHSDDQVLAVAGRDGTGTSMLFIIETKTHLVHAEHSIQGDQTVQTLGDIGLELYAVDVIGGTSVFNTSSWTFEEWLQPTVGPCQFSLLRTNYPWISGGVHGRLLVRENFMLNQTLSYEVEIAPVQSACLLRNRHTANIVIASPNTEGNSRIQVLYDYNGPFELAIEHDTEGTVTTIMTDPVDWTAFSVGFSNGVFKRYNVTDDLLYHIEEPDDPHKGPLRYIIDWIIGLTIIFVIISIVWWVRKGRYTKRER